MPRASRHFLPGHLWHITHRCHERDFLLKFAKDRQRYLHWLFEAKKRFGLCVLDYTVTCNHIHLLVKDTASGVIARSMQLIAGRTGQDYNRRKRRQGAFWEDRYHATAIEGDDHLRRCLVYIDLNMVRAGVVDHPARWPASGYREIQSPPERYAIIDLETLRALSGCASLSHLQSAHREWVEQAISADPVVRDGRWSEAVAVGTRAYVENVSSRLGLRASHREVTEIDGSCVLREPDKPYSLLFGGKSGPLRSNNARFWQDKNHTTAA